MLKNKIKSLIALIEDTKIEEIEVSSFWGAQKIRLSKSKNSNIQTKIDSESTDSTMKLDKPLSKEIDSIEVKNIEKKDDIPLDDNDSIEPINEDIDYYEIKAPLVGTFYSSPKPSDPPFIKIGDKIKKGQVICIIEAMKIFNEIEADITGIVHEISIENGSPVEYDQVIIKILPE